ncbi:MAG: hypothetical protein NXI27_29845 [Alphaproteobacteria bacterium]|nr:hypothetical protein [Alphaproteobacteria bacterium]
MPLPPLLIRSRPWSKNWPNSVIQELYGADRPSSGDTSGIRMLSPSISMPFVVSIVSRVVCACAAAASAAARAASAAPGASMAARAAVASVSVT